MGWDSASEPLSEAQRAGEAMRSVLQPGGLSPPVPAKETQLGGQVSPNPALGTMPSAVPPRAWRKRRSELRAKVLCSQKQGFINIPAKPVERLRAPAGLFRA